MKNYVLAAAVALMPMAASAVTIELDSTFGPGSNAGMLYSTGSGFYLDGKDTLATDATYVSQSFSAGSYVIKPTEDFFNSWSRWRTSSGCDTDGASCTKGFEFSFAFFLPDSITDTGKVAISSYGPVNPSAANLVNQSRATDGTFFDTGVRAFDDVKDTVLAKFTLDTDQDVGFFIYDDYIKDNRGSVSIEVSPVPLPAGLPLLLLGLGSLAFVRRKKA